MFTGQKAPNQHNLCHYDQIDLPLLEVSNPALQYWYVLGRPQSSPLLTHDASRCGGPERKAGGGLCLLPLGAVI